jgi:site-specific recombinase XerD
MHKSATRRLGSAPGQVPANKGKRYRAEVLSRAEADALIGACSAASRTGIRNRALITLLYRGGLRISEALALRPADVDPGRGTVRIMDGKGHKPRTVGLDPGAMATVQRWADKRREAGIRGRVLLCTLAGAPVSPQYARAMLARTAARAGIERRVVPHQLRHTHAAELEVSGVASAASFGRWREHALPAPQRAALEQARSHGSPWTLCDLGCHHPLASSRTMMQPVRLQRIPA